MRRAPAEDSKSKSKNASKYKLLLLYINVFIIYSKKKIKRQDFHFALLSEARNTLLVGDLVAGGLGLLYFGGLGVGDLSVGGGAGANG